jgi:hypothetical protein
MVWVVNLRPAPSLHLFERCTGEVVPALVVPVNGTVRVGHPYELRDGVGKSAKLVSFAKGSLRVV